MSKENLTGEDKEILRKRLELLQKEYEKTAQRLQRAERREAVHKHVQKTISEQNHLEPMGSSATPSDPYLPPETPKVRFHLPYETDSSPVPTLISRRSPSQRLRSKRSRMRLQMREKESDTDESQEKMMAKVRERWRRENSGGQEQVNVEIAGTEDVQDTQKSKSQAEEEQKREDLTWKETDEDQKRQPEDRTDVITVTVTDLPQTAVKLLPNSQSEVDILPTDQSTVKNSPSSTTISPALDVESPKSPPDAGDSLQKADLFNSCTLIEGLPFPVEYYIRTTRRMASSHSSVDINAVILSQLSRGRGRRRSGKLQTPKEDDVTLQPDSAPVAKGRCTRRGRRGRRGRRRTLEPGTLEHSSSQSDSLHQSQASPPQPNLNAGPEFKGLSDSQLYLDCQVLPDSDVYPIFRKRRNQTAGSPSQNTNPQTRLLPSLTSLAQALRNRDFRNLGRLLTIFDVQDFHLPDDEFGQLKLERLCKSGLSVEPLLQNNACWSFRKPGDVKTSEVHCAENEGFNVEPLPLRTCLESSLPLSPLTSTEQPNNNGYGSQSETATPSQDESSGSEKAVEGKQADAAPEAETEALEQNGEEMHKFTSPKGQKSLVLNLSMSLTSHTETEADPSFVSLGATPGFLAPPNLTDHPSPLMSSVEDNAENQTEVTSHSPAGETQAEDAHVSNMSAQEQQTDNDLGESSTFEARISEISPDLDTSYDLHEAFKIPAFSEQHGIIISSSLHEEKLMDMQRLEVQRPNNSKHFTHIELETACSDEAVADLCVSDDPPAPESSEVERQDHNTSDHTYILNVTSTSQEEGQTEHDGQTRPICGTPETGDFYKLHSKDMMSPETVHSNPTVSAAEGPTEIRSQLPEAVHAEDELCDLSKYFLSQIHVNEEITDQTQRDGASPVVDIHTSADVKSPETSFYERTEDQVSLAPDVIITCDPQETHTEKVRTPPNEGCLQKIHTIKVLDGGCVLDICAVRWSPEDWYMCVAGEWSVCVWTHNAAVQQWNLLYTWTFTQSVISLQEIPDSSGLLCVALGNLEITEARILCCPGFNRDFSQVELCKGSLQVVLAVSGCRVTSCSAPGFQQDVQVFTLTQDGSVAETLSMISTNHSIQNLATVEGEAHALIGWTEQKSLLIWNMKSGHLLQTVNFAESMSTTSCLRGYSHKGALCVLLQRAGACDEESGPALFTLIAMNPITGKYFTLMTFNNPMPHSERLIDGDVCESTLVGVFQSGRLAIWDLRGGVACVLTDDLGEVCRLARWAEPNILLTGYLNGDVCLYQYKPESIESEQYKDCKI